MTQEQQYTDDMLKQQVNHYNRDMELEYLAYHANQLHALYLSSSARMGELEKENEKLKSAIEERDIEIERRAHAANHNAHLCEMARAEVEVLERENERIRKICYSCEYCGHEPKLD